MFVPFIFSISTSLKTQREANQLLTLRSLFWPQDVVFDAYRLCSTPTSIAGL